MHDHLHPPHGVPCPDRAFGSGCNASAADSVTDSAGRQVAIPDTVTRVFAAGPPASTLLYVLAPQAMIGWVRAPRETEKPFLLPAVRDLPELGRLTGRGDTLNLERLIAAKPDLVIDFGSINDTYRSLADRVQAQTGIPYLLIDGCFENAPAALRLVADIFCVKDRGEALARAAEEIFATVDKVVASVPASKRPRVYLARGPEGFETGTRGSINTEIIERVGGANVAEGLRKRAGSPTSRPNRCSPGRRIRSSLSTKVSSAMSAASRHGSPCRPSRQAAFSWRRTCPTALSMRRPP
jgi:iron complex transport system substrate-binding protein